MNRLLEFASNHTLLVGATFAMAVAVALFETRMRARSAFALSATDVVKLINGGATVLDIRSSDRYAQGHIVGARNVAADDLGEPAALKLKKTRAVLVVCEDGGPSHAAASALRRAGFEQAFNLRGGVAAWAKDNLPLVQSGAESA